MFTALTSQLAAVLKRVTGRGVLSEHDVTEALREIRRHLLEADVSFEVTQGFVERVRERAVAGVALKTVSPGQQVVKLVRDEIARMLGATDEDLVRKVAAQRAAPLQFASVGPTVILLVGLQGSGKTTTAAKLARRLKLEQKAPGLVAADPYRPAAAEQLRQLGEQIGVPVFGMRDAGSGMGVVKLDGDARGGAALSIHGVTGLPIKFIGTGENVGAQHAPLLESFDPVRMAGRILGQGDVVALVEQAAATVDAEAAQRLERKARSKQGMDLTDFLVALKQMQAMGPLKQVLGLLPGVNAKALAAVPADDKRLKHVEAIVLSMTPAERADPSMLNGSRRQRIAKGAGRAVQDVN